MVCAQPYENCVQSVASGLNVIQNVSSENGGVAATPTAGTFTVSIDATSFTTRIDGLIAVDNRVTPYQRGISAASGSFGIVAHNYTAIGTATGDLLGARFSWATGNFPGAAEAMNLQATGLYLDSGVALNLPLSDGCLQISSGAVTSTPCSGIGGVNSVFTRIGAVTAQSGDYSFSQISGTVGAGQLSIRKIVRPWVVSRRSTPMARLAVLHPTQIVTLY